MPSAEPCPPLAPGGRRLSSASSSGPGGATDAAEELRSALAALGTDYIDVLTIYYVEKAAEWEEITSPAGSLRYLQKAKQDGVVRRIGVTSHQRKLASQEWRRAGFWT